MLHARQNEVKFPTNPFVAVWPGQDPIAAIEEHVRQTGHRGPFLMRYMWASSIRTAA